MTSGYCILALVAAQRLAELAYAGFNTRRLLRLGAVEIDRAGYPLFVALHAAWLASLVLVAATPPRWSLVALFALLQLGRLWVIAALGRYWTTRIITQAGAPVVRTGPFRFVRHPNYLLVGGEIAVLPLAFGALATAVVFTLLNLALLIRRIRLEDRALAARRAA